MIDLDHRGLSSDEATARAFASGPNELALKARTSAVALGVSQFANPLVLLLLGGAAIAAFVQHWIDAIAIVVIVGINAVVGFVQEFRAERAVAALRRLTAPRATVVRDGRVQTIPAAQVVRGDLLALEAGDVVAADARLVEANNLTTNEAVLTGESMPVVKRVGPTRPDAALAERFGDVFFGTSIASGTGRAVVSATAPDSEMGKIAHALAQQRTHQTPLQERLEALGKVLVVACLGFVSAVALMAAWRGHHWVEVLLTSVSLTVAAVPEGLPAVVTIALAVGVHRMSKHSVLVRRLSAVETLGSATVILTDKTGTVTTGIMEVRELWGADEHELLAVAAAASDAELGADGSGSGSGDAMELALLRAARARGIDRGQIERENPRVATDPFDAKTRRMSVTRTDGRVYLKGAFEVVSQTCGGVDDIADAAHAAMAREGLRVLAVAVGQGRDMRLVGLIGFADPPRAEAIAAIAAAKQAGLRVVMITGDHPTTARKIARELGLGSTEQELADAVIARATAGDKLRIVKEFKARGEVVAMTGDGVNDAPSIREADIGVAMGRTATEVTREAADMVLTTDDLGGIVEAIREGRVIYANIRKTVVYLLGGNSAELLLVFVATAAGLPMPLLPLQLLWINLLGEPLPGIALSIDPPAHNVLDDRPRPRSERLLGRRQWLEIAIVAALQASIVFAAFVWAIGRFDLATARTLGFSALVFGVVFRALASRSTSHIYWELDPRENPRLAMVVAFSVLLQLAVVYMAPAQALFGTVPLPPSLLGLALALGLIPVSLIEITKLVSRRLVRPTAQLR